MPTDPVLAALRAAPHLPLALLERLFDALPDVVFFVKDAQGRYTHANQTLLDRLRLTKRAQLVGRRADELFPRGLGDRYREQDDRVLRDGVEIVGQLELHLYPNRAPGWCLTHKLCWREPASVAGRRGQVMGQVKGQVKGQLMGQLKDQAVGLVGLSRDLATPGLSHATPPATYARVARVVERLQRDYAEPLQIGELARDAGLSIAQLERHVTQLYRVTPRQLLARARLDAALALLAGDDSIAAIAHACGYADHSAFARQFKRSTGISPRGYRGLQRP